MNRVLAFLTVLFGLTAAQPTHNKPNIVFSLVDDWGFAEAGFRNPAVKTSTFDMLATTGLVLNRHYVFKYCSPSRVSFLTGRWPHHAHQYNIHPNCKVGANVNMTMLPAKLKTAGYATHRVSLSLPQGGYDKLIYSDVSTRPLTNNNALECMQHSLNSLPSCYST